MELSDREIRMRILEALIPIASRVGLTDTQHIVKSAIPLEKYVLAEAKAADKPVRGKAPRRSGKAKPQAPEHPKADDNPLE